jgi:hypothetical protein
MKVLAFVLLAVTMFGVRLSGADLSGIWVGMMPTRNNQSVDVAFKLEQTGSVVKGKQYGDYKSNAIVEGKVTGDQVSFVVIVPEQAGNEINETRHRFEGTLKDGELELTRIREGATRAASGAAVQFKGESKVSFKLKRLY